MATKKSIKKSTNKSNTTSKKKSSQPAKINLKKKWYTLHDLPGGLGRNKLVTFVDKVEENADELDATLAPNEYWGIQARGKRTYLIGKRIGQLMTAANDSWEGGVRGPINSFAESVKILRGGLGDLRGKYKTQREKGLAKLEIEKKLRKKNVNLEKSIIREKEKAKKEHAKLKEQMKKLRAQLKTEKSKRPNRKKL